jgi:hypothetical protein
MFVDIPVPYLVASCLFAGAVLYTAVGHGGASAYLAIQSLFGLPAGIMRPTALTLNIIATALTSGSFVRAGLFRWRTLWPFLLGSVPFAFVGGAISLPGAVYRPLVGVVLLATALRLLWPRAFTANAKPRDPHVLVGVLVGAALGLLAGLTGTGGGIFLSPLLLFFGWSETRTASGVVAVFILLNSLAGLAGNYAALGALPAELPLYAGAVAAGALVGSAAGIRLPQAALVKLLGVVLVIAGGKLILS